MHTMDTVKLPETAVIGKEGLCSKTENVVQALWQQANTHFDEVAELGRKNAEGSYVGFWGAMSDEHMLFRPWTDDFSRGLYLAGVEVTMDAIAPKGWTKWVLPARTYLVVEVTPDTYGEVFRRTLQQSLPEKHLKLVGAVCDFTDPASGQNKLYFPVEEERACSTD